MVLLFDFIHRQFIYTPPVPTASFKGKTVIVTGSNVGLGKEACRWLVKLGASQVIIACRNVEKGQAAADDIISSESCSPDTFQVWPLDMGSYKSIQAFGQRVETELPRLDALISNAGWAPRYFKLAEGNEETINTNVISLFLHAFHLFPKLRETATRYNTETYFTVTASELYEVAKFKERKAPPGQLFAALNDEKMFSGQDRYNTSKLLEMFVIRELANAYPLKSGKIIMNCVAPGFCYTELGKDYGGAALDWFKRALGRPAEVGARTLAYGASAGPKSHGQYVPDCKITQPVGPMKGDAGTKLQKRVWKELKDELEEIEPGVTSFA